MIHGIAINTLDRSWHTVTLYEDGRHPHLSNPVFTPATKQRCLVLVETNGLAGNTQQTYGDYRIRYLKEPESESSANVGEESGVRSNYKQRRPN